MRCATNKQHGVALVAPFRERVCNATLSSAQAATRLAPGPVPPQQVYLHTRLAPGPVPPQQVYLHTRLAPGPVPLQQVYLHTHRGMRSGWVVLKQDPTLRCGFPSYCISTCLLALASRGAVARKARHAREPVCPSTMQHVSMNAGQVRRRLCMLGCFAARTHHTRIYVYMGRAYGEATQ